MSEYKYWWVICVYLLLPIIIIWLIDLFFSNIYYDFMQGPRIGEIQFTNSQSTIDNVISPFGISLKLILALFSSYFILRRIQKILIKKRIFFMKTKKVLECIEIFSILIAVIIAAYGKKEELEFLSLGLSTPQGNFLYNIALSLSRLFFLYLIIWK